MHDDIAKALGQVVRQVKDDLELKIERSRIEAKAAAQSMMALDVSGQLVKSWKEHKAYRAGDMVTFNGGLFQCMLDTDAHPLKSDGDWACKVNGVSKSYVRVDGIRERAFVTEYSDGTTEEKTYKEPIPIHQGTWETGTAYEMADEVAKDGHMWRSLSDDNTDEPGTSARWQMAAQRGKTGKPGVQGDRGEKGEKGEAGQDADPRTTMKLLLREMNLALAEMVGDNANE